MNLAQIALDQIVTMDPLPTPDRSLLGSMRAYGLFLPIRLHPRPDGTYVLADGRHRVAGARSLGWHSLPAIVEPVREGSPPTDLEAILINTQRQNLEQLHLARHLRRLLEDGFTQTQLARVLPISQPTISNLVRVLSWPDLVAAVEVHGLPFGAARAMLALMPAQRAALLKELRAELAGTGKFPSVREVEERVRLCQGQAPLPAIPLGALEALVHELQGWAVPIELRSSRGKQSKLLVSLTIAEAEEEWLRALLSQWAQQDAAARPEGAS